MKDKVNILTDDQEEVVMAFFVQVQFGKRMVTGYYCALWQFVWRYRLDMSYKDSVMFSSVNHVLPCTVYNGNDVKAPVKGTISLSKLRHYYFLSFHLIILGTWKVRGLDEFCEIRSKRHAVVDVVQKLFLDWSWHFRRRKPELNWALQKTVHERTYFYINFFCIILKGHPGFRRRKIWEGDIE